MVLDGSSRADARRRAFGRCITGAVALVLASLLAGCVTETEHRTNGATIAFESIDGPPRQVFERLVARLDAEARTRRIVVVSRQTPARYRVRAYLAAKVERRRTAITWVWDVYDANLRRATRIAGEEPAGGNRQNAWAAVEDRVLERIAEAGMTQLAAFAAGTAPPDSRPAAPEESPPEPAEPPAAPPAGDIRVAAAVPAPAASGGASR